MRVKTGTTRKMRHKRVLGRTKGFRMTKGRLYKVSKEADLHSGQYAFAGRRLKKRDLRKLWIIQISAGLKPFALSYSKFTNALKIAKVDLNRKMLSEIAKEDSKTFSKIVEKVNL